jgi:ligand-binding sensor domain-containing protein
MCRHLFIVSFFLFFFIAAFTQSPGIVFRHITKNNGLPVDVVTCLAQDSAGFMWIGTSDGLFRFDGFSYEAFYSSAGYDANLHTNYIYRLYTDSKGRLWISTYNRGLSLLEPGTSQIKQVMCTLGDAVPFLLPDVSDIKEDKNGFLFFATGDGLLRLSPDGQTWAQFKLTSNQRIENTLIQISFDPNGRLMIAGLSGLLIFDPVSEKFILPESGLGEAFKKSNHFRSLLYHEDKVWFSTWLPDLGVYDVKIKKSRLYYSCHVNAQADYSKMALAFCPDQKGNLWIATERGLLFVASGKDEVSHFYLHDPANSYSLISNTISAILQDREGNLWIGTNEGISIAQPYKSQLINYSVNALSEYPFGDKMVSDMVGLDDGGFLIGTYNADGIYHTNRQLQVQKQYTYKSIEWDWVWHYFKDEKTNQVYIFTQKGMLVYDQKLKQLRKTTNRFFLTNSPFTSIIKLSDDEVWLSRFSTFYRYNLRTGDYKQYRLTDLGEPEQGIFLSTDNDHNLWIRGHNSGLLLFDDKKEKIITRIVPGIALNSLRQSGVWVLLDLGESFFIGYDTQGVSIYNKRTRQFSHFTTNEGLAGNRVKDAFLDTDKTIWIATSNGITHFDPATKKCINYSQASGIIQNDIKCITRLDDGRIVAGTNKGIVVINPNITDSILTPPAPTLTAVTVLNRKIVLDSLDGSKRLQLAYKDNYVSFDFISPQFNNSNKVEYAYRMAGLNPNWIDCGNSRFIAYANLPAGEYTFKIKSRLPGGKWIEGRQSLLLQVQAAFYTRWWFFLAIGLIITSLVAAAFRFRLNQLVKIEKVRNSISSDLHDEVGATLTSISLFSEMARKMATPFSKEEEYLLRIGDRSRESIEKMSDIIWSINPNNDSLELMLIRMKNYTNEVAEAKNIAIQWQESGNLSHAKISMERRKNIYLFFKESVNNVVKHSGAKNIFIHLQSTKNELRVQVGDDGKGFELTEIKSGNGLKNIKRRAAALHGSVEIITGQNNGTLIQLIVPY